MYRPSGSEHVVCLYMYVCTSIICTVTVHTGSDCECNGERNDLGKRRSSDYMRLFVIAVRGDVSRCLITKTRQVLLGTHTLESQALSESGSATWAIHGPDGSPNHTCMQY